MYDLLSKLLPSHPDLLPIIQDIREKHDIPEVGLEEDGFTEFLLHEEDLDWDKIQVDIYARVREIPILPKSLIRLYQEYENRIAETLVIDGLDLLPEKSKKDVEAMAKLVYDQLKPAMEKIGEYYDEITNLILDHLITGRVQELPFDWSGGVQVTDFMGQPVVMAMAGQFSNPKEIVKEFRFEYTKTFGKDRPKITKGYLNTAEYLAMKMVGKTIADIADIYILRHPSQFPKDIHSKAYSEAKNKLEERLKKNMQRLEKVIDELIGDKN